MPVPTSVPVYFHNNNILKEFSAGWQGGSSAQVKQKEIALSKLKAEAAYSAESYFSTIYELLTNSAEVNLGDLSGTDLEKAETELFRRAIAESVYATMWFGDENGELSDFSSFTGFLRKIIDIREVDDLSVPVTIYDNMPDMTAKDIMHNTWMFASEELRALASEGNLAYFVSSDIYDAYQFLLDKNGLINHSPEILNGRPTLTYHGIPIIEIPVNKYNLKRATSFCILSDRRNLILALNTADSPEKEIRMWYNPDEMENRQRAVFLAGVTIADERLISAQIFNEGVEMNEDNFAQ
jgi:hypothetical protein